MSDQGHSPRVLVVDDDWTVRQSIRKTLEREGYRVSGASGTGEAWRAWEGPDRPFDLAVIDVALAGEESGITLAEELHWRGAAQRFLFISGYLEVELEHQTVPTEISSFIGKPLSMTRLMDEVRALLPDGD